MTAQSMQNVVHAGAPVPDADAQNAICEAYKNALSKYCANPRPKPRGKFNDYFFEALRNTKPNGAKIAAKTVREAPMMVDTGAAMVRGTVAPGKSAVLASRLAKDSSLCGEIAGAFVAATQAAASGLGAGGRVTGAFAKGVLGNQVRSCLGLGGYIAQIGGTPVWRICRAMGIRVRFLDGLYNGNPLEIKGPHDRERPEQFNDNKLLNKGREPFLATPEQCNVPQSVLDACPK